MKTLYFDCFSGISGDMTLAALLDLGIDRDVFLKELARLNLNEFDIIIEKRVKNGITGTDVNVILHGNECADEHNSGHGKDDGNHWYEANKNWHDEHYYVDEASSYIHPHEIDGKRDDDGFNHAHDHASRNLSDIEKLIKDSGLNQKVKDLSIKVFREIARAEAKVHNKNIDEVHFHEVGAVDSIVDIVGTAICLDILGVEKVYSSPLHDGSGFVKCQHGILPVPVPAVMEMLAGSGIPLVTIDVSTELVTPTGMGIIKCISSGFGKMPEIKVEKVGYGMGKKDTGRFNALRVVMGELMENDGNHDDMDEIVVIETNIDDMSSEMLGYTMEKLLANGALDVFYVPVYMKKNRPGVILTVLAERNNEYKLADIIMRETTTLGIRSTPVQRYIMKRDIITVSTRYGELRLKVASWRGMKKASPEYEDCRRIAQERGIPIREVYAEVMKKAESLIY